METNENTSRRLTQIAAILQIAYSDAIDSVRTELMEDKANTAIFKAASSWATVAELETAVVTSKAASRATLYRRLSDLVDRGLLERRDSGGKTEYRNSGVI
jgi:predicted transcriptional regulator